MGDAIHMETHTRSMNRPLGEDSDGHIEKASAQPLLSCMRCPDSRFGQPRPATMPRLQLAHRQTGTRATDHAPR